MHFVDQGDTGCGPGIPVYKFVLVPNVLRFLSPICITDRSNSFTLVMDHLSHFIELEFTKPLIEKELNNIESCV